jgi:hypothetical protein
MRIYLYLFLYFFLFTGILHSHAQIITTIAGNGAVGYSGNGGAATTATLDSPTCLAVDALGNLYINDQMNSCVRKVDQAGKMWSFAGTGIAGYNGDGGYASATNLGLNWGIAIDRLGNVYIADQLNVRVRKVNSSGIITTIAGTGIQGYSGDNGPATLANLRKPLGLAVDYTGNVYIGDPDNHCIRKVTPAGIITTFAGNGHFGNTGDGGSATAASFGDIWGLAADPSGNIYVCDGYYNRVRKVNNSGIVSGFAGNGSRGFSGDNGQATSAQLNAPLSVCVSPSGEIFIADCHNNRIRKVDAAGVITTIAGTGATGFAGDGGPAIYAQFYHPTGIIMDASENIYIADLDNVRIRKISNGRLLYFTQGHRQNLAICENSPAVPVNSYLAIYDYATGARDEWNVISGPAHGAAAVTYDAISSGSSYLPTGLTYTPAAGFAGNDTLIVRVSNGVGSDTTTLYITINPLLTTAGVITGDSSVCNGASIVVTDSIPGGSWSSSGAAGISGSNLGSGKIVGLSPGVATISYTLSNICNTVFAVKTVTVNPLPDISPISGTSTVCVGMEATITDAIGGGTWNSSNGRVYLTAVTPSGTESGIRITGHSTGLDTLIYTTKNAWCASAATYIVVVDTLPYAGNISGIGELCVGSQATLSDPTPLAGAWTSVNANAAVDAGLLTAVSAGTGIISYTVTNLCGSETALHPVVIQPLPGIPAISERLGILYAPAGYASYQWTLNGTIIPGAVFDSFPLQATGKYEVIVSNAYGCINRSSDVTVNECSPNDMMIYPNPASSKIYIQWCKKVSVRLICADGKEIRVLHDVSEVDLEGIPNGVYMLSVFDEYGNRIKTRKITKIE